MNNKPIFGDEFNKLCDEKNYLDNILYCNDEKYEDGEIFSECDWEGNIKYIVSFVKENKIYEFAVPYMHMIEKDNKFIYDFEDINGNKYKYIVKV